MADPDNDALRDIAAIGGALSFDWFKARFRRHKSDGVYASLDRGRAIIDEPDQLGQYLYSYGNMIESQWEVAAEFLRDVSVDAGARWIDYGCGQGLAGLLIRDNIGSTLLDAVGTTVLVEPSHLALRRAEAVYRIVTPNSRVVGVPKTFDDLDSTDFAAGDAGDTIHILSNVLDIAGYDPVAMLSKALSPGRHAVLAVSHDRNHNGGSAAIEALKAAIEDPSVSSWLHVEASNLDRFSCGNRGEPAIVWYARLEVSRE